MTPTAPYLRFELDGAHYGVPAAAVMAIAWLPELTHAEEAPPHIAGMINLRGRIIPVMDLGRRLGHPARRCRASDSIVILRTEEVDTGIIVSQAHEVVCIQASEIEPPLQFDAMPAGQTAFLAGNAKVGDAIVMLLDVARLIHAPAGAGAPAHFCPEASEQERAVFRDRAHALRQAGADQAAERIPLSIVQLGGEYFAVGLDVVREFAHLRRVTPVPCCPPHIAGNMNLRGDILTLIDIVGLLDLPARHAATEVMVIETDEHTIGVPVDQVIEVIYALPADITPLPAAAREETREYCKGVVRHGDGMVSLLDMRKILDQGGLEVAETV